jgi:hypothetical protein
LIAHPALGELFHRLAEQDGQIASGFVCEVQKEPIQVGTGRLAWIASPLSASWVQEDIRRESDHSLPRKQTCRNHQVLAHGRRAKKIRF